ncbi:hypothetical protein DY000_02017860 [Brassica cretica]|uniref:DUF740 domain-containing protein n=1 Tax=Brassica cretica TaxID=69181 RepID=A0ABQ7CP45_BRACR|nr:hypothetical protein DY000_02017860 [Brassica cretica]
MTHHQSQRRRRRHSAVCNRHPTSKPTTGFCATCLRERLSTIEALSSDQAPELRRARSHSVRDASAADLYQPRRRSCDDGSLHARFADDDEEERLGSSIRIPDLKEEEEEDEGRVSMRLLEEDGEQKTMKEFIDLESRTRQIKKSNDRTLKKLSLKQHPKNALNGDVYSKTALGRRSCDVDPRLCRVSFEEPRASWDGCLIGKTYPKLIPLSSVTEDAKASPEKKKGDTAKNNEVKTEGGNAMEGSLAESLLKLRRVAKGESNGDVSEKLLRSYSVSARKSCDGGVFHGASIVNGFEGGRSSCDGLFHGSITGGAEPARRSLCEDIQRDAKLGGASYSPDSLRNGMVRFYLTPLKSSSGKSRLMN